MSALVSPLELRGHVSRNRVMFGPIVTNLGDDERRFTDRHTAFYERRARGGCGIVVTEEAAVHPLDWPYERSPLAARCSAGWTSVANACHAHGSLVIAALGHTGGQGSSAYSQRELWAPSRVPEVNSREVPKWMEADDIRAVVAGFDDAARLAVAAGCDGVEINAGQHSLVRQFLSGLTNHRDDEWGGDRLAFARAVLAAARRGVGLTGIVGLRLSCDELAPWAGITPEAAVGVAAALCASGDVDYLVVTRGSIFSVEKTRADFHEPAMVNVELCRAVKAAVSVPVFLQGAIVDAGAAEWAIGDGVCDAVEMTRAQLADPDLVAKFADGRAPRPCIRCNQTCQVRDARNPIITCVVEPTTGRETEDPNWYTPARAPRAVTIAGGGPAGLETARVAALRGHAVTVVERSDRLGGNAMSGPGAPFVSWLIAECAAAGVTIVTGTSAAAADVAATGSRAGERRYAVAPGSVVLDVAVDPLPEQGIVALFDPIGGPIAIAAAERLGDRAVLITQDNIAGNELSGSGDLAPANVRLAQQGVRIERRSLLRAVRPGEVEVEDRFSGERRVIAAVALVDCGFRLPDDNQPDVARSHSSRIGLWRSGGASRPKGVTVVTTRDGLASRSAS